MITNLVLRFNTAFILISHKPFFIGVGEARIEYKFARSVTRTYNNNFHIARVTGGYVGTRECEREKDREANEITVSILQ